jgi:hypothetical protein
VSSDAVERTVAPPPAAPESAERYLDLIKRCVSRELYADQEVVDIMWWPDQVDLPTPDELWSVLHPLGWRLVQPNHTPDADRRSGRNHYPPNAETMAGLDRLDNTQELVTRALAEGVPGDLVETGIWRGGMITLMRAVLAAYGDAQRAVWGFDSFEGLPEPDAQRYPHDAAMHTADTSHLTDAERFLMGFALAIPIEQVRANIDRYGLLDERVKLVPGWFRDTLPTAPVERIAVLRLDGDLYESTMDALVHLEPRVSPGGFVIVDDYNSIDACRAACTDYRAAHGIEDEIHEIDWTGIWWQRTAR